jgi:ATP-dependent Lon protease
LTGVPTRPEVAMTGEITLRGTVLPIGGLTEKVVAAKQAGAKIIIIPKGNGKDLTEIPANVKKGLTFVQVEHMDEVLRHALERSPRSQLALPEPPPSDTPPEAFTHH